jgi:hypothetical protein
MDGSGLRQILHDEVEQIREPEVSRVSRSFLVFPRVELREWDYGDPGQVFPCWIVWEHAPSKTAIAYCEHGFGPNRPWGLLSTSPRASLGTDSQWYEHFECAVRESKLCDG